jgi:vacuolar-type H+-ATPase subunit F/Vma7
MFATNILILNSYGIKLEWTQEQYKAIKDSLKNSKIKNIQLYVEFMDTKNFRPTDNIDKNQIDYYTKKYKNIDFDVVVTTDDNALNFIRKFKVKKLFEKAKVFFCGVNNLPLYKILPHDTYAGVFEKKNPLANLNIAKKINKNLKIVYLISDETITASKLIKEYQKEYKDIQNIQFIYINHKNINDVTNELQHYDEDSVAIILLFTSFYDNNQHLSIKEMNAKITEIYKKPILIHTNIYLDYKNIIGGNCVSGIQ